MPYRLDILMNDREKQDLKELAVEMGGLPMSGVIRNLIREKRRELGLRADDQSAPVTYPGGGVGDLGKIAGLPEPGEPARRLADDEDDPNVIDPEKIVRQIYALAKGTR